MSQGGLKHAATESRIDSKRERRRGASGRAAVLRRAPSDSDCSGETASLSADSGDRAVRPPPPPARANKSRSRRRGSEWEVLEGLKDGQRFEKRPDVFNGYLHKKRKWPLKGWHKRFFVVDGGILVYARSPSDVARGRLHGSVDVGLSVISAKPRRRRVDIDADEFIYHLRAKTPEVFRVWLNVLKAHRLYRQHLLTFGARESVPKIHAPLEDLPPTETSSRTSLFSSESSTHYGEDSNNQNTSISLSPSSSKSEPYSNDIKGLKQNVQNELIMFKFQKKCFAIEKLNNILYRYRNKSLCSVNRLARYFNDVQTKSRRNTSQVSTDAEKQIHTTDLEVNLNKMSTVNKREHAKSDIKSNSSRESPRFNHHNTEPTLYFFSRAKRPSLSTHLPDTPMKRSKKSTNLFKYRNSLIEPKLKAPLSKCLLLKRQKVFKYERKRECKSVECDTSAQQQTAVQTSLYKKEIKSLQDLVSASEYDRISEKIMITLFEKYKENRYNKDEIKSYVNQVVEELYDVKFDKTDVHPVKMLFRSLLEYWLKNTTEEIFKETLNIDKLSGHCTKDNTLSKYVSKCSKATQIEMNSFCTKNVPDSLSTGTYTRDPSYSKNKVNTKAKVTKMCNSNSLEKENRIQELETVLKNTVYACETRNDQSKEKDITITKKLIENLEKMTKNTGLTNSNEISVSNPSSELPKLQETINHLISDTSIPADVAKDLLNAYLGLLLDSSNSIMGSKSSGSANKNIEPIACEVITEAIQRKVSKSAQTNFINDTDANEICSTKSNEDSGKLYLKDVFDKITTIFTKSDTIDVEYYESHKAKKDNYFNRKLKRQKRIEYNSRQKFLPNRFDDDSVVVDLSKYDLEHISMYTDPKHDDVISITIKLKEKPKYFDDGKNKQFGLKLCNDYLRNSDLCYPDDDWLNNFDATSFRRIFEPIDMNFNAIYDFQTVPRDITNIEPYKSSSDATSKDYREIIESSDESLDLSFKSSNFFRKDTSDDNEEIHPCYIVSSLKSNALSSKRQCNRRVCLHSNEHVTPGTSTDHNNNFSSSKSPAEYAVFEQPAPKVIDEKFILLLLENITLLSKNLPSIHKDLNALYIKLRKRYEKILRNNLNGVGLLGRIYHDDYKLNCGTQIDEIECNCDINHSNDYKDVAVNSFSIFSKENAKDKNVSTLEAPIEVKSNEVQTECIPYQLKLHCKCLDEVYSKRNKNVRDFSCGTSINTASIGTNMSQASNLEEAATQTWHDDGNDAKFDTVQYCKDFYQRSIDYSNCNCGQSNTIDAISSNDLEYGTSVQNWNQKAVTAERSTNTVIRTVLDNIEARNSRKERANKEIHLLKVEDNLNRRAASVKNEFFKSLTMRSPLFLAAKHSKKERVRETNDTERMNRVNIEYNTYRVVLNEPVLQRSSSMIDSSLWSSKSDDIRTLYRCTSAPLSSSFGLISPTSPPLRGPQAGFVSGTPGGRLASWIIESGGPLENASRELGQAQLSVQQLQRLLETLELQQQVHHDTDVSLEGASPNVKKDRRKFGLRKKKSNSKCASVELAPPHIDSSSSHMALSALTAPPSPGGGASSMPNSAASLPIACAAARPQSLPGAETLAGGAGPASITSLTPDHQLREDFTVLAKDLVASLKGIVSTLVIERGRLRAAVEATENSSPGALVAALRTNLSSALHQNNELRSRLSRIHDASDLAEVSSMGHNSDQQGNRAFQQSLSYSSSCVSASEFFDAEEHEDDLKPAEIIAADEAGVIELDGDSSSEAGSLSSEEGSASSENSDGAPEPVSTQPAANGGSGIGGGEGWARRARLPSARPNPGGPSLWNLLYKNIGKDLSQISMPVTINEPLNMLQRLCEELEYSELLDAAADCRNEVERMALIAAFAVSAYSAAAHRAASKPFNPLLAETYECQRQDRGFKFLAEQVSHHPPISACHAESDKWVFWQEARIKTKFWGKSMEFQPAGSVHVMLKTTGDHYSWNKVTTCVHNLFGGQRWVDQYGDMHIVCHGTDITCKLNFIKASSWSSSRHEVRGMVTGSSGRLRLQGRWSEALYGGDPPNARCLWRPGAMPAENELYYGFTRFATELNEIEPGQREQLPHTDTRLRPDQRALEEGAVEAAERLKLQLEQQQRDRRRLHPAHHPRWFRKIVENGEEMWVFTNEYWRARERGFPDSPGPPLW